jgi:hypothetical protein
MGGRRVRRNRFVWSGRIFSGRSRARAAASANSAPIKTVDIHGAQPSPCPVAGMGGSLAAITWDKNTAAAPTYIVILF